MRAARDKAAAFGEPLRPGTMAIAERQAARYAFEA